MVGDARAGDVTEVPAEVEAAGTVDPSENVDAGYSETMNLERLVVGQLTQRADVAARRDDEVAGRVRVLVEDRERDAADVYTERLVLGQTPGGLVAEDAALVLLGALDVLEPPGRPEWLRHSTFVPRLTCICAVAGKRNTLARAMSYPLKLGAAAIAILTLGLIAILIFDRVWFQVGFGAAVVLLCVVLLGLAWMSDRKAKKVRGGIDELPPV